MLYKLFNSKYILQIDGVRQIQIPIEPGNIEYQKYLAWCALGNSPLPADPVTSTLPPVSPRQFRQALTRVGLRTQVESYVSTSTDQDLKDWYNYASEFDRNHPLVITTATALGQTAIQLDALWNLAITL